MKKSVAVVVFAVSALGLGAAVGTMYARASQSEPEVWPRLAYHNMNGMSQQENAETEVALGMLEDIRLSESIYLDVANMNQAQAIDHAIQLAKDTQRIDLERRLIIAWAGDLVTGPAISEGQRGAIVEMLGAVMTNTNDTPRARRAARKLAGQVLASGVNSPSLQDGINLVDSDPVVIAWLLSISPN